VKNKWMTVVAIGAVAVLGLAGCSSASPSASTSPTPTATGAQVADNAALEAVTWTADDKGVPTLGFTAPFTVTGSAARLVKDGDGATIEAGQIVQLAYTVTDGSDASVAYSTYDAGTPEGVMLTQDAIDPVLWGVIVGAKVGASFIYAVIDQSSQATPPGTVLMAVTVQSASTPLARAVGTAVDPVAGLPTVTLADSGAPSVSIPVGDAPSDLVSQTLIEGDGATVKEGDNITVHYTGWLWDGTQFDSSWDKGSPLSIPLATGSLIDGWVTGLADQKVGSQVLLVIPPSLGYGSTAQNSIPADSTLVFVVDILAAN